MEHSHSAFDISPLVESAEVSSWNRTRGTSELLGFIARRESALADYGLSDDL